MFPLIIFIVVIAVAMYAVSRVADKMTVRNPVMIMQPFSSVEQYMRIRSRLTLDELVRPLPRFVPASASQDFGIKSSTNPAANNARIVHEAVKKVKALKPVDVMPVADIQLAKASEFGVKPQTQFVYSPSKVLNLAKAKDFGI